MTAPGAAAVTLRLAVVVLAAVVIALGLAVVFLAVVVIAFAGVVVMIVTSVTVHGRVLVCDLKNDGSLLLQKHTRNFVIRLTYHSCNSPTCRRCSHGWWRTMPCFHRGPLWYTSCTACPCKGTERRMARRWHCHRKFLDRKQSTSKP